MEKRNNILCLFNAYWGKGISGGDLRFIEIVKRGFSKEYPTYVLTSRDGKDKIREYNVCHVRYICVPSWIDKFGIYIAYMFRILYSVIWYLIKSPKPIKFFYSTSDFIPDVILPYLFKSKSQIWIQVIHHLYPPPLRREGNRIRNTIGYFLQRLSLFMIKKKADKIIVVNNIVYKKLLEMGVSFNRLVLSSNGIDYNEFQNINKSSQAYDAVFVGRICPQKGIMDLISVWSKVTEVMPNTKLGIIGVFYEEDSFYMGVMEKIRSLSLETKIEFLGNVEREVMKSIISSSKIFIFPSHEEGWGIAIAEAMACQKPVVAWDLPVYKQVFDNTLILIPKRDYDKMAKTVIQLLEDKDLRETIGKYNKEWIKRYDWAEVAKKEVNILKGAF